MLPVVDCEQAFHDALPACEAVLTTLELPDGVTPDFPTRPDFMPSSQAALLLTVPLVGGAAYGTTRATGKIQVLFCWDAETARVRGSVRGGARGGFARLTVVFLDETWTCARWTGAMFYAWILGGLGYWQVPRKFQAPYPGFVRTLPRQPGSTHWELPRTPDMLRMLAAACASDDAATRYAQLVMPRT